LYTHPLSQARISDSRVRAQQYPKRFVPDSSDFALAKARVIARYQQEPKDAFNHFQKELSLPGGNTKANQYGLALTLLDTGRATDADKILTRLREQDPKNLFYLDAYTDVLLATGRGEKALQLLEQEFLLRPNNLVITLNYANAAKQLKSDRLALHLLKNLLYAKPDTYLAYEMLVDVYKSLNDMARYHEARADLYYQLAIYPKAIDELNEALNFVAEQDKLENRRLEAKKKHQNVELIC
jgi:predicted Zn-dependent protease